MNYIKDCGRNEKTMLPDCICDYVGEDNPVRVIDAFVDMVFLNSHFTYKTNLLHQLLYGFVINYITAVM